MRINRCFSIPVLLLLAFRAGAEVHSLTLRDALELAAKQNPDVTLARLDQQYAQSSVEVAKDPFRPKVYVGSGLAYTYGYPNSIDGNAPSLAQFRTDMYLYNKPKSYALASTRELERSAGLSAQSKAQDVAYQAASLFLTASQIEHEHKALSDQLPGLQRVVEAESASVTEGSELPLELKRARVNLAVSQQRLDNAEMDGDYYRMLLAVAVGYTAMDRVKPLDSDLSAIAAPPEEHEAMDILLRDNRELQQMQSRALAKELDIKSAKAMRLPQVGLVAQYSYFARYNFEQYFQKFQHNNFQVGASISIPVLVGSAANGMAGQYNTELQKIKVQIGQLRNRLIADTHRDYELWTQAQKMRNLTRLQLELAREDLGVKLAQNGEGRLPLNQLEQARVEEANRWIAFYQADLQEVRAKLAILKQTGTLLAAVRDMPAPPQGAAGAPPSSADPQLLHPQLLHQ